MTSPVMTRLKCIHEGHQWSDEGKCQRCGKVKRVRLVPEPKAETPNRCMECGAEIPDNQTWCGFCQNFDEIPAE